MTFLSGILARAVGSLGLTLLIAGSASAVSAAPVWHQEYQRASEETACSAPAGETPWQESFTGQREWTPSWAQWPNDGEGGWVCQRSIGWARTPSNCQFLGLGTWGQFGSGVVLPSSAPGYSDSACTVPTGSSVRQFFVLADSTPQADSLCLANDPNFPYAPGASAANISGELWICNRFA